MNITDIQPVVLYITEERRLHVEKQLHDLPFVPIFYKGYLPTECTSWINYKHPEHPEKDTTLCCMRSHIGVLKHFLEHSSKNIALVLEDDVLFTKDFMRRLESILELWQKHESEIDYVSIGYLPNDMKSKKNDKEMYWDLYCNGGSVWGAQGYLVKRSVVEDMVRCLDQPSSNELNESIQRKIKTNGRIYSPKVIRAQADVVFSVCWRQAFIKPMLVIESPLFNSTISETDSNANTRGWNKAFQTGELRVEDFAPCCELYLH